MARFGEEFNPTLVIDERDCWRIYFCRMKGMETWQIAHELDLNVERDTIRFHLYGKCMHDTPVPPV